jgi:hypothetical protein
MTEKQDFDGLRRIEQFVREGKKEMKSAKRWTVKWDETEIPDGEYVRASDYEALSKELMEACSRNARYLILLGRCADTPKDEWYRDVVAAISRRD